MAADPGGRSLHPDRDNPRVVWHCAREAVKKRPEA